MVVDQTMISRSQASMAKSTPTTALSRQAGSRWSEHQRMFEFSATTVAIMGAARLARNVPLKRQPINLQDAQHRRSVCAVGPCGFD